MFGQSPHSVQSPHSAQSLQTDAKAIATLERHPDDGWVRADPWPMSPGLLRVVRGLVTVLCPPAEEGAPTNAVLLDAVTLHVRKTLSYMNHMAARGVLLVLVLLDWSPLWRLRGLWRLH